MILEDVYTKSKGTSYYARDAVPVEIAWDDPEAALDLVRRTEGVITDSVLVGAISAQAQVAPASAVAWGQPLLAQILDPAMRLYAVVQLGMAAAPSQPDLAVKFYEQAEALNTELNALGQQDTPHDIPRMMAAVMLAALAARLGRPEAAAYLDAGITCARAALPAAARHGANEMLIGFCRRGCGRQRVFGGAGRRAASAARSEAKPMPAPFLPLRLTICPPPKPFLPKYPVPRQIPLSLEKARWP